MQMTSDASYLYHHPPTTPGRIFNTWLGSYCASPNPQAIAQCLPAELGPQDPDFRRASNATTLATLAVPGADEESAAGTLLRGEGESLLRSVAERVAGAAGRPEESAFDLFHGTDAESARNIVEGGINEWAARELGGGDGFYTTTNREHADLFANSNPSGGPPAVVGIRVRGGVDDAVNGGVLRPHDGLPDAYVVTDWERFNEIATFGHAG